MSSGKAGRRLALAAAWLALVVAGYFTARWLNPAPEEAAALSAHVNLADVSLALPDLSGEPRRLADFNQGPLLVNFWATWCAPCRKEMPLLKSLQARHGPAGLTVVGVAVDEPDPVRDFVREFGIDFPILVGEESGIELLGELGADIAVLPVSVFVSAGGEVTRIHMGELHEEEAQFALRDLLP